MEYTTLASLFVTILMFCTPILGVPALISYATTYGIQGEEHRGKIAFYGTLTLLSVAIGTYFFWEGPTGWMLFGLGWLQSCFCLIACWGLYCYAKIGKRFALSAIVFLPGSLIFVLMRPLLES
jgi:hypothetical protein